MRMLVMVLAAAAALTAVRDSYPSLSPNGSMLLFQSNRTGRQAIWMARADGSEPHILFDDPEAGTDPGTPAWSPDGREIAFAMKPAGAADENESEIYVIRQDGSGLQRLTLTPGDDSHPHWSADGKRIFFNSARATPDLSADWSRQWIDIYSMGADGRDVRRHTWCKAVCTYPIPSPDGRWIVHRKVVPGPGRDWEQAARNANSEVFLTRLDGSHSRNLSNDQHFDGWPTWTSDGRWILFSSGREGVVSSGQVYRIRPDGTGLQRITSGPFGHVQPSVSAEGRKLLVYQVVEQEGTEIGQIAQFDLDEAK